MYISKKVLFTVPIIIALLIGVYYFMDYQSTKPTTTDNVKAEDTKDKVDPKEEEYFTLFKNKNYEQLSKDTGGQDTNLKRDFYLIANAFMKFEEMEKNKGKSSLEYTDDDRLSDYNSIVNYLTSVKNPPSKLEKEVAILLDYGQRNYQYLYNKVNPDYVGHGVPQIGMTRFEALKTTWKNPTDINITKNASSTREQWVYSGFRFIYFDDGILTTIQD